MRLSTKIAYNTIIQIISKVIAAGLGLIAIAMMTRYLGQAGFGQYTTIVTFLSFFAIIADLGLTLVTVQMISRPDTDQDRILSNLMSLRLVSALLFLGLAPLIVIFFPYQPIIKLGVAITSLSFFFIALNQILVGLFQKNLRLDKVSLAEVSSRLALVAGVGLAVYFEQGLIGIMIATVLASVVSFLLHYLPSRHYARIQLKFELQIWRQIIKKSWPLALTIVFNLIYLKADTLILSLLRSQAEVGIYGASYKVIDVLITLPFMFAGIILPLLTVSWAKQNQEQFKKILQKSFDVMIILAVPLVIGTQFLAEPIMILIAGDQFALAGPVLRILILAAGIIFIGTMFAHAVIALDRQKKIIGAYLFTALSALIGYLIFIPRYSYFGAAWITIYSELIIALASIYFTWKYARFLPSCKVFFKALAASLIMAGSLYWLINSALISQFNLLPFLALAILIYFLALYLFKGVTKQDLMDLINK